MVGGDLLQCGMAEPVTLRPAGPDDLQRILDIYNHEVVNSTATYDTAPRSMAEQRAWFGRHGAKHPVIVALDDGRVCAWASLSPWAERAAYDASVEVSVYVDVQHRRRGIGKLLLSALVEKAHVLGHHAILARISSDNDVSVRLHAECGFSTVGTLKEVGIKFGRLLDVAIMELLV
jgi:L-amino acid N-acyltransferase YncA